ncbi:MAG: Lrp/AsnC family transcriptional regulator [Chloroflexi bacterium]|nr:Lrp/AsnC family transcriptional regulator [Chloroflexota bacterium]
MSTRNPPVIDHLDTELIRELETDAAQTYTDLATKLHVSRNTVRSRFERLQTAHVIRPVCYVPPEVLGYSFNVSFGINTQPGKLEDVANQLASWSAVHTIILCIGRFDITGGRALFRDRSDLLDFLNHGVGSIAGIRSIEIALQLHDVKLSTGVLANLPSPTCDPTDLDSTDLSLIRELQRDPRQTITHIAKKIRATETTVMRRMQRLKDKRVINIIAATNPFLLGYDGVAAIWMKADLGKVAEVANSVASYPDVRYVGTHTGSYNIIAWVIFKKLNDLGHFLNDDLGRIPGLRDIEPLTHLKIVKSSFRYLHE